MIACAPPLIAAATAFEAFPSGDQRVVEGLAHASEALADVDAWVNLLDSRLSLRKNAIRPQRPVQAFLGEA
jgi:hypothetical protein